MVYIYLVFLFYFCNLRSWKVNIYHYYSTQLMPYIYYSVLHISLLCRRLASAIKRGQSYFHLLQKEEQEEHEAAERQRMRREEQLRTEPRPPSFSSDSDSDSGGWGNISSHQLKSQEIYGHIHSKAARRRNLPCSSSIRKSLNTGRRTLTVYKMRNIYIIFSSGCGWFHTVCVFIVSPISSCCGLL